MPEEAEQNPAEETQAGQAASSGGVRQALNLARQAFGAEAGGGAQAATALATDVTTWLQQEINQWKLRLLAAAAAIFPLLILFLLMNVQYFLANLVGLRIPKILPKMPWWEEMALGLINFAVAFSALMIALMVAIIPALACSANPIVKWGICMPLRLLK